jgi:hypothetical protein
MKAMRVVYRVIAYLIALAVALQAASVAMAFFGLGSWVDAGGVLDKSALESGGSFTGEGGLAYHVTVGFFVIPALGLLMLISSFFTRSRGAIGWAGIVFGSIIVQVLLGGFAHTAYIIGAVHGLFAFVVLAAAVIAAMRMARAGTAPQPSVEPQQPGSPVAPPPRVDVG